MKIGYDSYSKTKKVDVFFEHSVCHRWYLHTSRLDYEIATLAPHWLGAADICWRLCDRSLAHAVARSLNR